MNITETEIKGVLVLEGSAFNDDRGKFYKPFQKSILDTIGIDLRIKENFFSISNRGVIRGLHFQLPPYIQEKLIYVPKGKVLDIILDLRVASPSYKRFTCIELSEENNRAVYIPAGCAHGFQSLQDDSITIYLVGEEYNKNTDSGINPLSVNIDWPIKEFIISNKDKNLINFNEFNSPF